jgi:general secretion pathway protein D
MTQDTVEITKDKVPVLGSIPLLGRMFRSETRKPVRKTLIVFITPTVIDPTGNRVQAKK